MDMAISDEELMERVVRGDLTALGELYDRYQPLLFAFLCRFLGNPETAEDVVQGVFWRVWKHRSTYRPGKKFATWVYTIARNTAIDEIRKSYRCTVAFSEISEPDADPQEILPTPSNSSNSNIIAEKVALRIQVQKALDALPPDQRIAIILREYEGRSYKEIGEILDCSEGNARVLTYRARQTLRKLLTSVIEEREG